MSGGRPGSNASPLVEGVGLTGKEEFRAVAQNSEEAKKIWSAISDLFW